MKLIEKNRLIVPMPILAAKITASLFELLPSPLITNDQLRLLKYDSILSGKYKSNVDINYECKLKFEDEVQKYCYMWKEFGEYSKKKID